MNVNFVETMRGTLLAADGTASTIEFEVHAHAEHLRTFLKDGQTRLRGIIRAPGFAAQEPAHGTLTIDLPRSLTYLVTFQSDGVHYRLEGKKTPSLRSPLRSMTVMDVVLKTDAGTPLAHGQMTFALRELGGFLASWLPLNTRPRVALDVRRRLLEREAMGR